MLSKDSLDILTGTIREFKKKIDAEVKYLETTEKPIVSFGLFRDFDSRETTKDILSRSIGKITFINRNFKEVGVENGVSFVLNGSLIKSNSGISKDLDSNFQRGVFKILSRISEKLDKVEQKVNRFDSIQNNEDPLFQNFNFPQLQRYESDMSSSVRLDTSSMNTSFKTKNTFGFTNGKKIILCDNPISEKNSIDSDEISREENNQNNNYLISVKSIGGTQFQNKLKVVKKESSQETANFKDNFSSKIGNFYHEGTKDYSASSVSAEDAVITEFNSKKY